MVGGQFKCKLKVNIGFVQGGPCGFGGRGDELELGPYDNNNNNNNDNNYKYNYYIYC